LSPTRVSKQVTSVRYRKLREHYRPKRKVLHQETLERKQSGQIRLCTRPCYSSLRARRGNKIILILLLKDCIIIFKQHD